MMVATFVLAIEPSATAQTTPVSVTASMSPTFQANGRDGATITVSVVTGSTPLAGAKVHLTGTWLTPSSPGALHFLPSPNLTLNAEGQAQGTASSTRSGTVQVTASVKSHGYTGSSSVTAVAERRSVVVLVNGGGSSVSCPTPTTCSDTSGLFNPVRSALAGQGFAPGDLATFSYTGGSIDPATDDWVPNPSTCADSATSYKTEVAQLRTMIRSIATANPNSDITLIGLSQGGLLVFQMLGAQSGPLPDGSKIASIATFDAPLGGVPLANITNFVGDVGISCWADDGPAVSQLEALWNTTAPTQGTDQGDRATLMCSVVKLRSCPAETNESAVTSNPGIATETWGNTQDAAFYPPECSTLGSWPDALDSQVVSVAGGGLHPEGVAPATTCDLGSHLATLANHTTDIANLVGSQQ